MPARFFRFLGLPVVALLALSARAQTLLDRIPADGQPWRVERAEEVPPPLAAALKQADCRQDEVMLLTFPIELFRPAAGSRAMAIAPCRHVPIQGRAFMLDGGRDPQPLAFPVMAFPGKVSASETPGLITWNPFTRMLSAIEGSDVCEGTLTRHSYRHDPRHGGDDLNGFALVKLERGRLGCNIPDTWQVVWEAGTAERP
jgi:hypothetical protein